MWLTRVSISNPVMAVMCMAALLVLGALSYRQLRVDQYPALDFPVVVQVEYPGASPEVIEAQLARPIEAAVNDRRHQQPNVAFLWRTCDTLPPMKAAA